MTVLTRADSKAAPPAGVAVKAVDYASVESLTAALQGADAVVSVLGSLAIGAQRPLVDAALAVGSVRRFVPSEFGVNTRKARDSGSTLGKVLAAKTGLVDYLIEQVAARAPDAPPFAWTGISIGHFFDWGLAHGVFPIDPKARTATIIDSGNERFGATNLPQAGRAVAAVLRQAGGPPAQDTTANRYIEVVSATPTLNELLAAVESRVGGAPFAVKHVASKDVLAEGEAKLAKGDFSAFGSLLNAWQFADGAGHAPNLADPESGNQLLGVPPEDFEATVAAWLKG